MNKKINIINIIILLFFFVFILNITHVEAACIDTFGSITNIKAGSNNEDGGRVRYSDSSSDGNWSDKEVTFNVLIQADSWYKVSEIYYSVESDGTLSCEGQLDPATFISNTGSVSFSVKINKAYVQNINFYGKSQKRRGSGEKDIQSTKLAIRFKKADYMPNVGTTTASSEKDASGEDLNIGVGESLACKDFGDFFDRYWKIVCIIMPIVLILLVSIDFVKATVNDKAAETMKTMTGTAMKRTIALILLLWLPILCRMIFKLFGIEFCL